MASDETLRAKHVVRPAPPSAEDEAQAKLQADVDEAADQVMAVSQDAPGYAGLSVDPANMRVDVWWNGRHPQALLDLAAGRPHGVELVLHEADYSHRELEDALSQLMPGRQQDQPLIDLGVTIHRGGLAVDGSGLRVTYSNSGQLTEAEVEQTMQGIAGVPVRPTVGVAVTAQPGRKSTRRG